MQIHVSAGNKNKCSFLRYKIFLFSLQAYNRNVAILHQIMVTQYTDRWKHTLAADSLADLQTAISLSSAVVIVMRKTYFEELHQIYILYFSNTGKYD
jgi:hypothetical protein